MSSPLSKALKEVLCEVWSQGESELQEKQMHFVRAHLENQNFDMKFHTTSFESS